MSKNDKRTIAVDFDGVIHRYSKGYQGGELYDNPVEDALQSLLRLKERFKVVIFTTRASDETQVLWIKEYISAEATIRGIDPSLFEDIEITNKKPMAIAYIDDRAVRFTNWRDMMNYFM